MPAYRIHRLRDHLRQQFRSAPHLSGRASVKSRDYRMDDLQVEAPTPYAAFFALKDASTPLKVGDLLEDERGALSIFKFVGFEEAQWVVPQVAEPAPPEEVSPALQ